MTLQEKLAALTPEQVEKLNAVKTAEQLDAFLAENKLEVTDEEKQAALEYIKTGVLPLDDEELENVAGGLCKDGKGRYVVTLITPCAHNLTGLYESSGRYGNTGWTTLKRNCGDGGKNNSRASNGWCEYCVKEKAKWLCDYPKKHT